jgi:hypothetical protein
MQNLRALAILHQGTYFMALQIFFENYQLNYESEEEIIEDEESIIFRRYTDNIAAIYKNNINFPNFFL